MKVVRDKSVIERLNAALPRTTRFRYIMPRTFADIL